MSQAYLITVLEHIGAPLLAAANQVCAEDPNIPAETRPQEEARRVAALMGKTVEASIEIGNLLGVSQAPNIEELRVSLAALAAGLIADLHRRTKALPGDEDLKAIYASVQSVMGFSQSFALSPEADARLKAMGDQTMDSLGAPMHYLAAFLPVMNVAAGTSLALGFEPNGFVRDVAEKLTQKAAEIVSAKAPGSDEEKTLQELHVLRSLCVLYTESHKEEIMRMSRLDEAARADMTSDAAFANIWQNFDRRVAMLQALTHSTVPGMEGAALAPPLSEEPAVPLATAPPAVPPSAPAPPPVQEQPSAPVVPETPAAPPPQPVEPPAEQPAAAPPPVQNDPMAMFAKKPADPPEPPAPPPQQEPPPAEPPPPAAPPAEDTQTNQSDESGDQSSGGGDPMSFFTKKSE